MLCFYIELYKKEEKEINIHYSSCEKEKKGTDELLRKHCCIGLKTDKQTR